MNDLDLVRTLRADVPFPTPARMAAGRSRVLAAASRPRYRRLTLPVATAAAAAALAAATVLGGSTRPSTPRPAATGRANLAVQILTVAAKTVAAEPSTRPGGRQWIYSKFVQTQTGQATQSDENWIRFDGLQEAYLQDGQLIIHNKQSGDGGPLSSYNELASLPSRPSAILAAASSAVGTTPREWENWSSGSVMSVLTPKTQGQAEFDYLALLLWNAYAAAPPAALAHVYQAMADIPGVIVDRGLTNAVGRAGIGVSEDGGVSWLLLDPRTYQVIGVTEKVPNARPNTVKGSPLTFSGTISMAWADVTIVSAPGER